MDFSGELMPSLARSFTTVWAVHEDYVITTDGVGPHGAVTRVYAPIVHRELPPEFAKLHWGNATHVQQFVREYGLLGQHHLLGQASGPDQLDWVWAHAETVRFCLELTHLLQQLDVGELRRKLQSLRVLDPTYPTASAVYWPRRMVAYRERILVESWAWGGPAIHEGDGRLLPVGDVPEVAIDFAAHERALQEDANLLRFARTIRRDIINENIALIHRSLMEDESRDRSYFRFRALIEVVYWLLADVVDSGRVKTCETCGAFFVQTDPRQRFCPPRFKQKESPCAIRQRVRKHLHKR